VVFDLDGTLIDSESLVLEAYMAAARTGMACHSHMISSSRSWGGIASTAK
jgi:beta-phosphoglucomutase-like phosphatase (HAD superfamily)